VENFESETSSVLDFNFTLFSNLITILEKSNTALIVEGKMGMNISSCDSEGYNFNDISRSIPPLSRYFILLSSSSGKLMMKVLFFLEFHYLFIFYT
jgi:hypothetical protein